MAFVRMIGGSSPTPLDFWSYIDIATLPTKLAYNNGESIDITGIVVKAYAADGSEITTINNADLTYTPTASPRTGMTSNPSNAILTAGQTVISENNGSNPVVKKKYDGYSFNMLGINALGSGYGGNWFTMLGLSDDANRAEVDSGGGTTTGSYTINNMSIRTCHIGMNAAWTGGITYITNPLNLPETQDVQWTSVNSQLSLDTVKKFMRHYRIRFTGGAVTISATSPAGNTFSVQYGISVS